MRYCFCVLGWHYLDAFYEELYKIAGDKYVISHRDRDFVAATAAFELVRDDVHFLPNRGLDWGGYHQFNELVDLSRYDFVVYCHDDLRIKDPALVEAISAALRDPAVKVVGNGNNGADSEFQFGKYRHRMSWNDDDGFVVRTVRGSFFAARTEIFATIGNFPVYWEASARNMKKGNISLRNFGYLVTKHYGIDGIAYLEPESWLETRYVLEMRRGEPAPAR